MQVAYESVFSTTGLLLSHGLRLIILWNLNRSKLWVQFIVRMIPAWIAVSLIWSGIGLWMILTLFYHNPGVSTNSNATPKGSLFELVDIITLTLPLMIIWTGFYLGIRVYRQTQLDNLKLAQLQAALHETELRTLKAQLDPHFLFNSLNSLRALIPESNQPARLALTRLADLLRATLQASRLSSIRLEDEWTTTENYLQLEQLRRGNRLRWTRRIEPSAMSCSVPPLVLQGLVENALKHGLDKLEDGGEIQIEGAFSSNVLTLSVSNPGTLDVKTAGTGVGVANARARLQLVFGPNASLEIIQSGPQRVRADIRIPQPVLTPNQHLR